MEWHDLSEEGLSPADDLNDGENLDKDSDVEEIPLPKRIEAEARSPILGKEKSAVARFESLDFAAGELHLMTISRAGSRMF